ncbi:MAG: paraslipin [Pseudomonadales bacterium RIFCSPLOWO2_02_FULL_63_210]|nr:MAG: paraslipin [Pseudomonadales bacterium RIFCSPLOWO2_02_FULL_63_210]
MEIGSVIFLFVGLAVAVVFMGFKVVPQGSQWTVERFGRYTNTLTPGLNIIVPVMDRIGHKLSVMETVLDIPPQEVITADNATVQIDAVCFFQVINAAQAAYEVNEKLLRTVDEATAPWGIKITRIEIKDISPPADLMAAMSGQMKAERIKRAQILEAEGLRAAAILTAEGKKQAQILEAEGQRQAAFLEAEARERAAGAEAEATRVVSEAIASGNVQAINYFVAQKYIDALGQLASANNSKVILMPLEASQVIGAVSGIGEIVKATFGDNKQG